MIKKFMFMLLVFIGMAEVSNMREVMGCVIEPVMPDVQLLTVCDMRCIPRFPKPLHITEE